MQKHTIENLQKTLGPGSDDDEDEDQVDSTTFKVEKVENNQESKLEKLEESKEDKDSSLKSKDEKRGQRADKILAKDGKGLPRDEDIGMAPSIDHLTMTKFKSMYNPA